MSDEHIEHSRNNLNREDQNRRDFNREDFNREVQNRTIEKVSYKDLDPESQNSKEKGEIPPDTDEGESRSSRVYHSTWLDEEFDDALRISELMGRR